MTWVVDTGPLSHFSKSGWLGVIKMLAPDHCIMIPEVVRAELDQSKASRPYLASVLEQDWITVHEMTTPDELTAFARYTERLVGDDQRNLGECGVLALAETHGWIPVLDDAEACKAARDVPEHPLPVLRTLRLLCDAVNEEHLTAETVSEVADSLTLSEYRVPFPPGGFLRWARDHDLLR